MTSKSHSSALAERDGERIRERGKENESLSVDVQNSFFFSTAFLDLQVLTLICPVQ